METSACAEVESHHERSGVHAVSIGARMSLRVESGVRGDMDPSRGLSPPAWLFQARSDPREDERRRSRDVWAT